MYAMHVRRSIQKPARIAQVAQVNTPKIYIGTATRANEVSFIMKLYRWSWAMQIIEHFEIRLKLESEVMSTIFGASLYTPLIIIRRADLVLYVKLILRLSN